MILFSVSSHTHPPASVNVKIYALSVGRFMNQVGDVDGAAEGSQGGAAGTQTLASSLEKALSEVSSKYRSCLPEVRFPQAYAETINRLCS